MYTPLTSFHKLRVYAFMNELDKPIPVPRKRIKPDIYTATAPPLEDTDEPDKNNFVIVTDSVPGHFPKIKKGSFKDLKKHKILHTGTFDTKF
jgi:hypothetical protein